eukprot:CAMPEP_0113522064 /NCGR_PEP_ID=MMETSP0014_2-20120614/44990_1 /TAXON_ID=2857 /ORGANISM="Nitzschia sp." /LENGTH=261 /DNA_ID=CAMNT_0000420097 /DNA_START=146 /DNA_END=931 /DNA_ORIENTATION=+ /assembly_acc=CAM_ASM_000159
MTNAKGLSAGGDAAKNNNNDINVGNNTNNINIVAGGGGTGSSAAPTPAPAPTTTTTTTTTPPPTGERHPTLVHRKVAILGFRAVGKSSIVNSFVSGSFSTQHHPTIENTFHKTIRFRKVHFQTDIVDTAGMDEFSRLSRNASLGVHGYILVFSIGSRQSYEMIGQVNDALLSSLGDLPDVPRVLVGTMKDLPESKRQVSTVDGQRLADSWGGPHRGKGIPYIEVSSKTGENVAEVFHTLLKEIEKEDGFLAESESGGCTIQ